MGKFQKLDGVEPGTEEWFFYCPGCKYRHLVRTRGPRPCWNWNGDPQRPTMTPSYLLDPNGPQRCHSFITDGRIQFLDDCYHALKGQTVELPECPQIGGFDPSPEDE